MRKITNYAQPEERDGGFESVNEILAVPRYKRSDLVRNTVPKIDQKQIDNWLRFGYLDLKKQMSFGNDRDFRRMASILRENENLGPGRRYTGGDILKVMMLQAIGQIGLPYTLAAEIIPAALERAANLILNHDGRHGVIVVIPDGAGEYKLLRRERGKLLDLETEWFAVIDIDEIIKRFFATPRGRQTGEQ